MDVEDTAHLVLGYPDFSVQINLCFMQRHNRRDFSISGSLGYLGWTQNGNVLSVLDYGSGASETQTESNFINDDMFINQADFFLKNASEDTATQLEAAQVSVAVVEAAKLSMISGREEPFSL